MFLSSQIDFADYIIKNDKTKQTNRSLCKYGY